MARQPILVGVGQLTNRTDDPHEVIEPLAMMTEAARLAAEDAEAPQLLAQLDSVTVINIISRRYPDPAGQLAARLGAHPAERLYTTVGGNSPQWRVNEAADRIARSEIRLALIAGAEAIHGRRLARKAQVELDWSPAGTPEETAGDQRQATSAVEQRHHAQTPTQIYPLFENALRAHRGWSIETHRAHLAAFCARFAAVARDNPYAWFRDGKSAEQIGSISDENRLIAFPYPKFMNAIINVDQAAALVLTEVETARRLGIPEHKWVYPCGCGDATDHWYIGERVNYFSSPAIRLAGERALAQAGLSIDAITYFDLYSCFPCAPQIAADMLGIPPDDARLLTVTGGLAYHGGPGSNYSTHAIACVANLLRQRPGSSALISGVGWYMTKHTIGVYSSHPPRHAWRREDPKTYQPIVDKEPHPPLAEEANGQGKVETYTVSHDREGNPAIGIIVVRLFDGHRCWANVTDPALLHHIEQVELIGQTGQVRHHQPTQVNVFEP